MSDILSDSPRLFSFRDKIITIPINILVSESYQRPINYPRVKRMIEHYNANANSPIYVNFRDNRYVIVDGQHRVAMMKGLGFSEVKAMLFNYSLTIAEEADAYHYYSRESKQSSLFNDYAVLLQAGDPDTTAIERILAHNGFYIANKSEKSSQGIRAIKTLRDIYHRGGEQALSHLLHIWHSSWPSVQPEQTSLRALAQFYFTYHDHKDYHQEQLINRLSKMPIQSLLLNATAASKLIHGSPEKHLFEEILQSYNKGRHVNRLPDYSMSPEY